MAAEQCERGYQPVMGARAWEVELDSKYPYIFQVVRTPAGERLAEREGISQTQQHRGPEVTLDFTRKLCRLKVVGDCKSADRGHIVQNVLTRRKDQSVKDFIRECLESTGHYMMSKLTLIDHGLEAGEIGRVSTDVENLNQPAKVIEAVNAHVNEAKRRGFPTGRVVFVNLRQDCLKEYTPALYCKTVFLYDKVFFNPPTNMIDMGRYVKRWRSENTNNLVIEANFRLPESAYPEAQIINNLLSAPRAVQFSCHAEPIVTVQWSAANEGGREIRVPHLPKPRGELDQAKIDDIKNGITKVFRALLLRIVEIKVVQCSDKDCQASVEWSAVEGIFDGHRFKKAAKTKVSPDDGGGDSGISGSSGDDEVAPAKKKLDLHEAVGVTSPKRPAKHQPVNGK